MQDREYSNIDKLETNHFWYRANRELGLKLLKEILPYSVNIKILDAGCGPGGMTEQLQKLGRVVGVDVHPLAIKLAREKGLEVVKASVNRLPFVNNSFDLVTSFDVLYHQGVNPTLALKEFKRVLKKEGWLLLRVPAFEWLRGPHDEIVHTAKRFTLSEVKDLVIESGFKIIKESYFNTTLLIPIWLMRNFSLQKDSDVKVLPGWVNKLLEELLNLESWVFSKYGLPFGVSIYCLAQKP